MDARGDTGGRAALRTAVATPAAVVGALVLAVFLVFVGKDGGYPATVWYPGALFLLGLLAVTVVFLRPVLRRPALGAIACLAAFTLWSFASLAWSGVEGDAWDGANRTLLYLVVYGLFAAIPWSTAVAALILCGFAFGTVVIGVITIALASVAEDPGPYFIAGRLSEPMGYQNADAAIFLLAFWPLLMLATRREAPPVLRALALAGGGLALELAVLAQARASLVAVPVTLLGYLVLVPGRLRALVALLALVAVAGAAATTLLDVYPAIRSGDATTELDRALGALALSAVVLLVAGLIWGVTDRRINVPARAIVALRRAAVGAAALAALIAIAVVLASDPVGIARDAWEDFKVDEQAATSSSFARGLSTNRYDIWRVAWHEFGESPVYGIGADNFGAEYVLQRRGIEETLYPHSLQLRTLAQLGLVGAALLAAFFALALVDALRRRFDDQLSVAVARTAIVVFGYWFVHGSVDWFWEIPALTCPALAFLGLAGGVGRSATQRARSGPVSAVGLGVVALAATASLALPWLAEKEMQQAAGTWRSDANQAFSRLERARALNRLSDKPDTLEGAIASRVGDTERMNAAFQRALVRNPHNWYAQLELAILAASQGKRSLALNRLAAARALNPREPALAMAREQIRSGRKLSFAEYDRLFFARAEAVVD